MSYQTIEEYFTQFPDDVEKISVDFKTDHLPDLSRFYKLKILWCSNNKLTCLPLLPSTLKILWCSDNKLTWLPLLPSTLKELWCSNNKLTCLPLLSSTLTVLVCHNNQLTRLPLLPSTLTKMTCHNNKLTCLPLLPSTLNELYYIDNRPLILPLLPSALEILYFNNNPFLDYYIKPEESLSMTDYIAKLRNQIEIINNFRELFYALKYKKQFKKWLWHIREPKIRNKYKPENLIAMLEGKEDITLDELDELLEKW